MLSFRGKTCCASQVALHPEGVDRNRVAEKPTSVKDVALHPEGVDRNCYLEIWSEPELVALHPEGVDRNRHCHIFKARPPESPSTRRAWIEIRSSGGNSSVSGSRPPPGGRG